MNQSDIVRKLIEQYPLPNIETVAQFRAALQFAYHFMRASVPLLQFAATKMQDGPLRDYYLQHAEEERGHTEMAVADLQDLGKFTSLPDHAAAAIVGAQYYYLEHVGPVPLLGYMAALEFRPYTDEMLAQARRMTGGKGLSSVKLHADSDRVHREDLSRWIDRYAHDHFIVYNAAMTARMYAHHAADRIQQAGG